MLSENINKPNTLIFCSAQTLLVSTDEYAFHLSHTLMKQEHWNVISFCDTFTVVHNNDITKVTAYSVSPVTPSPLSSNQLALPY